MGRPELGSLSTRAGAVPRCEPVTRGQGARPKEARTTGYQGHGSVPTDVMRDPVVIDGRTGWTGQVAAAGYGPGGQAAQTVPDGRRAGVDTARVAGSNVDLASQTSSVWAGVEPMKLYTDAGYPYWSPGIAGIPPLAYPGQPNQLRPAASMPYLGGYVYPPLVMNPGTGSVPAPILSQPIESWVRAPL